LVISIAAIHIIFFFLLYVVVFVAWNLHQMVPKNSFRQLHVADETQLDAVTIAQMSVEEPTSAIQCNTSNDAAQPTKAFRCYPTLFPMKRPAKTQVTKVFKCTPSLFGRRPCKPTYTKPTLQAIQTADVDQEINRLCLMKLQPKPRQVENKKLGPIVEIPIDDFDDEIEISVGADDDDTQQEVEAKPEEVFVDPLKTSMNNEPDVALDDEEEDQEESIVTRRVSFNPEALLFEYDADQPIVEDDDDDVLDETQPAANDVIRGAISEISVAEDTQHIDTSLEDNSEETLDSFTTPTKNELDGALQQQIDPLDIMVASLMDKFFKWNGPKSLPISSHCDVKSTIAPLYLPEHFSCHLDALLPPILELLRIPKDATKIGISNTTVDTDCNNICHIDTNAPQMVLCATSNPKPPRSPTIHRQRQTHPSRVQNEYLGPIVEIPIDDDDDILDSFIVDVQQEHNPKDNEPTPDVLGTKGFQHVNPLDITATLLDTQAILFQCDINQHTNQLQAKEHDNLAVRKDLSQSVGLLDIKPSIAERTYGPLVASVHYTQSTEELFDPLYSSVANRKPPYATSKRKASSTTQIQDILLSSQSSTIFVEPIHGVTASIHKTPPRNRKTRKRTTDPIRGASPRRRNKKPPNIISSWIYMVCSKIPISKSVQKTLVFSLKVKRRSSLPSSKVKKKRCRNQLLNVEEEECHQVYIVVYSYLFSFNVP
jgi:hypothetical protein